MPAQTEFTVSRGYGIAETLPESAILLAMAMVMFGRTVRKFKWD